MPCGKTHFKDSLIATGIVTATAIYYQFPVESASGLVAGCIAGCYVTPDLDLGAPIYGNWVLRKHPAINLALRLLGAVYGGVSSHRGASHWLLIGTLSRILLLTSMIYLIPCIYITAMGGRLWLPPLGMSLWAVVGMVVIDSIHIAHDHLWSWVKRDLPSLAVYWET